MPFRQVEAGDTSDHQGPKVNLACMEQPSSLIRTTNPRPSGLEEESIHSERSLRFALVLFVLSVVLSNQHFPH